MGEVRVKIVGLNLPRLINRLIEKNVLVTNLVYSGKSVKFSLPASDLEILNKICKIEHKYYVILQKSGLKQLLSRIPYFLGTLVAIIISYLYMYSFNSFIFNVDINCNSDLPYDLTNLNQLLYENGIVAGMKKNELSVKNIQNLIMLNIDDLSGCSVILNGGNLNIEIYPSTKKIEVSTDDIVSKYNAVVTKAEAYSGELLVKPGDIIEIGDTLIKNKNGASGKIEGKVYFVSTIIYNENQQYTERTGNTYKLKNINFCNWFKINGQNKCGFASFEVEKVKKYVATNLVFPIAIEEEIYYEVQIKTKVVPFETVESSVTNSAYNEALKLVPNKDNISNVTYSVVKEGPYTRVDCFIESIVDLY